MAAQENISYHSKRKKVNLTTLSFADGLEAYITSVKHLKEALDEFYEVPGVKLNASKSIATFGGISDENREELLKIFGCAEGGLPLKYLAPEDW